MSGSHLKRSLWVQGYTVEHPRGEHRDTAFPVGTGIYRLDLSASVARRRRSLWVQGYTDIFNDFEIYEVAFPVGTGIYRRNIRNYARQTSVPCGYRDIP